MRKKPLFLTLFIVPLLFSCVGIPDGTADDTSGTEDKELKIDYSIFDNKTETVNVNKQTFYLVSTGLYVNKKPGVYNNDFALEFAYNPEHGKLYLNFGGENPSKTNECYTEPFKKIDVNRNVPKSNNDIPLTASVDEILQGVDVGRCVSDNYINNVQTPEEYEYFNKAFVADVCFVYDEKETNMSLTYLVDNTFNYYIPIIFLSMPYSKWFGANPLYNNIIDEIEERVHVEYFDPISKDYWQRNSKIKLGGGWSKGYPQRTLNLNFKKDENGNKNEKVKTPIFKDRKGCGTNKDLTDFIRFRLHNGGNCFESWSGFNDAILQRAMVGTNVGTTAYRPCLVYLNGEYWGLMSIREHYSDYYIKQNYGVDDSKVTMFELDGDIVFDDGDDAGVTYVNELKTFLNDDRFNSENEALVEEAYSELCEMVDMDSFLDVLIPELYACNWDFIGNNNNLKMWRVTQTSNKKYEDGKWRFCMHDADFAFTEDVNFLNKDAYRCSYNNWPLLNRCMKSRTFRNRLIARAQELVESNLDSKNMADIAKSMYDEVDRYKADFGRRWGQPESYYNDWKDYYDYLVNFFQVRSYFLVDELTTTINNQYGGL